MKVLLDEIYIRESGRNLRYDYLRSSEGGLSPAVVCIHGGGWISGDKADTHPVAQFFAENGFAAFCPQYRLAPLHTYPAAVEDCQAFVAYLRANANDLQIHPEKIGAIGNSAGGYFAVMLAVRDAFITGVHTRVNAAVDICGLTDLTHPNEKHPKISLDFISQYMGKPFEGNEELWLEASPLYHVDENASPLLIFHGMQDDVVLPEQSIRLHKALTSYGVKAELVIFENEWHSFSLETFEKILQRSLDFFSEVFEYACRPA